MSPSMLRNRLQELYDERIKRAKDVAALQRTGSGAGVWALPEVSV